MLDRLVFAAAVGETALVSLARRGLGENHRDG
jgi:hypothetical protein